MSDDDLDQAVRAIGAGALTQSGLDCIRRIIDQGRSSQLVAAMLSQERALGRTAEAAVSETMRKLERLGQASQPFACILMTHLHPAANDLYMHDVCDAIDLWIADCSSDELTEHLKQLASSETNANWRRHYASLLARRSSG